LRAPARTAFRKLGSLGFGIDKKEGNKHRFYVKDMAYPEPPKKTEVKPNAAKTKEEKK
jgi:hypothetical protein